MICVGIDPGKAGGISILHSNGYYRIMDMPLLQNKKGIDTLFLFEELKKVLQEAEDEDESFYCMIEKTQAMPRQGVVSTINYGIGYGKLLGCMEILHIPFKEVRPTEWKKEFGLTFPRKNGKLSKSDKKIMSVNKAIAFFPRAKSLFYTKKGRSLDGRAESLLIAKYCLKKNSLNRNKRG